MFFAPVILALATSAFDSYGFPRLNPGLWLVTTTMRMPERTSETRKYCVAPNAVQNLLALFLAEQEGAKDYNCEIKGSQTPGSGTAFCSKLQQTYTGMNVIARLNWSVTMNRPRTSFTTAVAGNVSYAAPDPRVPYGETPFTETISGAYQGVSCVPTPAPSQTPTPTAKP